MRAPAITASGAPANQIIFQKSGVGANPIVLGTGGVSLIDACIQIVGGDYITFDGIDVKDNPANATNTTRMEFGYLIMNSSATNGAQNNTIKNTTITLNRADTSTIGIFSGSDGSFTFIPSTPAGANSNNRFYNLTIHNSYAGIYLSTAGSIPDTGCEIGVTGGVTQNTIGDVAAGDIGGGTPQTWGIRTTGESNFKIFNNEIKNISNTSGGSSGNTADGIFIDNQGSSTVNVGTNEVYNNRIHDVKNTSATSSTGNVVSGIRVNLTQNASSASHIYNNFIYNLDGANTNTTGRRIGYAQHRL